LICWSTFKTLGNQEFCFEFKGYPKGARLRGSERIRKKTFVSMDV